ncbi:hypothetical protein [Variovorax sp. DAIF25]|uniref:hypothetical protein n=1 Tax=Variovorax sp. DAIF25 TaxID=3080983 RepID=UPI003D6A8AF4
MHSPQASARQRVPARVSRIKARQVRIGEVMQAMRDCTRGITPQNYYVSRGFRVLHDLWCCTLASTPDAEDRLRESARLCIAHGCEPRA